MMLANIFQTRVQIYILGNSTFDTFHVACWIWNQNGRCK